MLYNADIFFYLFIKVDTDNVVKQPGQGKATYTATYIVSLNHLLIIAFNITLFINIFTVTKLVFPTFHD